MQEKDIFCSNFFSKLAYIVSKTLGVINTPDKTPDNEWSVVRSAGKQKLHFNYETVAL